MKVLVFPKDGNPYQELLYKPMREANKRFAIAYIVRFPFIGALPFPLLALLFRLRAYKLIHIHWPAFTVDKPIPFRKQISWVLFKFCIWWLKFLSFKIVWTVHNVMPHELQTLNDHLLMQKLARAADKKIVHSDYTINQMKEAGLDTSNCKVIPIGSYGNIYKSNTSRNDARKKLAIKDSEFVILFFGLIRPYKGVEDLIKALNGLNFVNKNIRLIIAGKCEDESLAKKIKTEASAQSKVKIDFYNKFIPDEEVAKYFKASDVVCLPFRKITTSSSALLAMAFSKPIIAPRLGALLDLPQNTGIFYDPKKPKALEDSIKKALKSKASLSKLGNNAKKYSNSLSWDKIAKQTYEVYEEVLSRPAKEKSGPRAKIAK